MSWLALAVFAVGNVTTRALGMFVFARRVVGTGAGARLASLVPLSVVTAVFAVQTFTSRGQLDLDPRIVGVACAGVAAWRGTPMVLVVIIAAAVTAGLRAVGV